MIFLVVGGSVEAFDNFTDALESANEGDVIYVCYGKYLVKDGDVVIDDKI